MTSIDWSKWGSRRAVGHGTNVAGMGAEFPMKVELSKPDRNCDGKRFFTKATFTANGRTSDFKLYTCP